MIENETDEKCTNIASNLGENLTDIYKNLSRILNNNNNSSNTSNAHVNSTVSHIQSNNNHHDHHQNSQRTLNLNKISIPKPACLYLTNESELDDENSSSYLNTASAASEASALRLPIISAADAPSLTTISSICQAAAALASSKEKSSAKATAKIVSVKSKPLNKISLNQYATKVYYNNKIYSNGKLIEDNTSSANKKNVPDEEEEEEANEEENFEGNKIKQEFLDEDEFLEQTNDEAEGDQQSDMGNLICRAS